MQPRASRTRYGCGYDAIPHVSVAGRKLSREFARPTREFAQEARVARTLRLRERWRCPPLVNLSQRLEGEFDVTEADRNEGQLVTQKCEGGRIHDPLGECREGFQEERVAPCVKATTASPDRGAPRCSLSETQKTDESEAELFQQRDDFVEPPLAAVHRQELDFAHNT